MAHLYDFVMPVRQQTLLEFCHANPQAFLLLEKPAHNPSVGWTFKTQTVSVSSAKVARFAAEEELRLSPELSRYDVFALAKAAHNPWPERISVGRARNNDVVLSDSSVSKLHAHFRVSRDHTLTLTDAGSRNGTRLNDVAVPAGESMRVQVGDTITFGRTTLTVVDAAGIYQLVSRFVQDQAPPNR